MNAPFRVWLYAQLQLQNNALFCAVVWNLWKWRNSFAFDQTPWHPGEVLRRVHLDVLEFQRWGSGSVPHNIVHTQGEKSMSLHTDGSWQQHINMMGGGGVIRDNMGRWVSGFAVVLGPGDAFKAEIVALTRGLGHAWNLGYRDIDCFVDCLELQMVLASDEDVQHFWHGEEIQAARAMLAKNWKVTVRHVPRERNQVADAMAKLAVRERCDWKIWSVPPSDVIPLLCQDFVV